MRIALVDVDGHNFPNLALMKLSAWHKLQGDQVEWYRGIMSNPDKIYASKVFTFTPGFMCCKNHRERVVCGGKEGMKYGDSGKCYTGKDAKQKAAKQGRAIEISRHK